MEQDSQKGPKKLEHWGGLRLEDDFGHGKSTGKSFGGEESGRAGGREGKWTMASGQDSVSFLPPY